MLLEMENVKPRVAIYLHPWSLITYNHNNQQQGPLN